MIATEGAGVEGAGVEGARAGELRKLAKKELEEEKRKRISLERECAVYQSQLEVRWYCSVCAVNRAHVPVQDFHRKLELEKSDRRVSESRALQLLQEVKEKGLLAQQLRREQSR